MIIDSSLGVQAVVEELRKASRLGGNQFGGKIKDEMKGMRKTREKINIRK